jgi:membrane fusion protein, multidrug efflux system
MTNEQSASPKSKDKPASKTVVRVLITTLVLAASLVAVVTAGNWVLYRGSHVVVDNAMIKGSITKLGARLDGQIKAILVEPGQRVTKGQVLVRLEDQHLQAAWQEALAQLESSTNELHTEKLAIEEEHQRLPVEVERADSMRKSVAAVLEGAKSNATRLESEYARIFSLSKDGIVSSSQLDLITAERAKAQADVKSETCQREAAQSAYETAKLQLQALRVREARLGVLQAQVSTARAKVAAAEANLDAAVLRAPEEGWVVERILEPGGSAKVGEPMLSLWIGKPWVEAWVSEKTLQRLHVGSEAEISLDAFPHQTLRGRIDAFGLLTDKNQAVNQVPSTLWSLVRKSALVAVRISIHADNLRLQPGLSAVVGIAKDGAAPSADPTAVAANPQAQRFASSQLVLSAEQKPIK